MTQSWHNLLFAHWRVDERLLRPLMPAAFDVDRFDGAAWLGIVPFTHDQRRAARRAGAAVAVGVSRAERAHLRQPARRQARRLLLQPRRRAAAGGAGGARDVPPAVLPGVDAGRRASGATLHYRSRRRGRRGRVRGHLRARRAGLRAGARARSSSSSPSATACITSICSAGRRGWRSITRRGSSAGPRGDRAQHDGRRVGLRLDGPPLLHFAQRQDVVAWWPRALRVWRLRYI